MIDERRRPVAPPSSSHHRRYSARYGLTDPSDPNVYFVGASGIHPSRLRTSSDSRLGGLVTASGGLANALGGLAPTPDDVFFAGGRGSSARAKKDGLQDFKSTTIRLSYSRRYMLWSKDNWNLDCYYLRSRLHKKESTSCSKPKELFLQSQEMLQENEPDR